MTDFKVKIGAKETALDVPVIVLPLLSNKFFIKIKNIKTNDFAELIFV